MLSDVTESELHSVLDQVVEGILAAAGWLAPPCDAATIARRHGMDVALDASQSARARLVCSASPGRRVGSDRRAGSGRLTSSRLEQCLILLRPEPRLERRQWAIAHELGEHFAVRVFDTLGFAAREAGLAWRETVANWLASRLLLPTPWFGECARDHDWDLPALKRRFTTASHELIARRMLDFSTPIVVTVRDQGKLTWRRANVNGGVPPPSSLERQCWDRLQAGTSTCLHQGADFRLRGWAIHEPGWKREISRLEWTPVDL